MASSGSSDDHQLSTAELDAAIRDTDFFRSLVENGSDAIVSIDEDSTIVYANQSVKRVFGYAPDEMVGEPLTLIMPDRFHDDHFAAIEQYLQTGDRQLDWNDIQLPAEHADGYEIPLSITFEQHVYEGQRLFSGIMRDVSDRVERQRALERQNERLERFASIVSHDLRDPLQTARATLAVARAGDEAALDELDAVFDRMETLIDDVLTLAKQGEAVGETDPIAVATVAEDAWTTAGPDAHADADVELVLDDGLPTVAADGERLRTVFENLFRNAIEHGDAARIRVGPLGSATAPTGFFVADDGTGLPPDTDPEAVFSHGYTTSDDGTGLGLRIVDEIVQAHGWTVQATTAADGGVRFEITTGSDTDPGDGADVDVDGSDRA